MTESCRPCPPGQYSLGGGARFEEFYTLPPGFSVENFDANSIQLDDTPMSAVPCPPEDTMQSLLTKYAGGAAKTHKEEATGDWQKRTVDLRSGANVVSWVVTNSAGLKAKSEPIRISRIDVLGLAFTRECTLCPPGTSSAGGAAECTPCGPGFFAPKGAAKCGHCPQTHYSGPKAERCSERPACRPSDYYPVTEPCTNGTTRTTYKKVQPAVCRDDIIGAATVSNASYPGLKAMNQHYFGDRAHVWREQWLSQNTSSFLPYNFLDVANSFVIFHCRRRPRKMGIIL
ncbi:unnamed protein product [Heligmosomoides polygyrus]|uniref:Ephrin_rec_like domain-containing protein n=1 Tax=Heligmosomoides polygyrus TaxID=6339 RepID=A0A183FNE9_HELPZ|nr:unnamed protein product [Heligmosomoides polygyrus]